MTDQFFTELQELRNLANDARSQVVGVAICSVAWMNLGEFEKAHLELLKAVAQYQLAAERVERFQRRQIQSEKENPSNGNRNAA